MSLTKEQQAIRKLGVGGSEIAAVLGLSPYAGPLDVYLDKTEDREREPNHHMERGTFLEAGVADWYAHRTGMKLLTCDTLKHPAKPAVCTPDRLTVPGRLLSIKVPGPYTRAQWGEDGTDEVPEPYMLQLQWEFLVLRANGFELENVAHLAAPIDGDLRIYPILSDAELQAMMLEKAERFWRDYVEKRVPPPPDGSDSCAEYLAKRYPRNTGGLVPASGEAAAWAEILRESREAKSQAEVKEKEARNQLVSLIGEADGMEGDGFRIMHTLVKGKTKTDWEAIATEAGVPRALIEKHTTLAAGYRRFVPKFGEK